MKELQRHVKDGVCNIIQQQEMLMPTKYFIVVKHLLIFEENLFMGEWGGGLLDVTPLMNLWLRALLKLLCFIMCL